MQHFLSVPDDQTADQIHTYLYIADQRVAKGASLLYGTTSERYPSFKPTPRLPLHILTIPRTNCRQRGDQFEGRGRGAAMEHLLHLACVKWWPGWLGLGGTSTSPVQNDRVVISFVRLGSRLDALLVAMLRFFLAV